MGELVVELPQVDAVRFAQVLRDRPQTLTVAWCLVTLPLRPEQAELIDPE